jgi:gelsolin
MLKQVKYNIEDSNIANLGSELEKNCKLAAAKTEKAWANAGKVPGLLVWRIENFQVKLWTEIGTFYSDDSFIVLNTYTKKDTADKLYHDVHFWLGETTSQDEAGTAAYKTVELDDVLGGAPVQHREVQGKESKLFLSYFQAKGIKILSGGVASGFNHVKPEEFVPRLLWIKGKKNVRVTQVPLEAKYMNSHDIFLVDAGLKIYQWNGRLSSPMEKMKAMKLSRALDDERKGLATLVVFDEGDKDPQAQEMWALIKGSQDEVGKDDPEDDSAWEKASEPILFQLSDATGEMKFTKVKTGHVRDSDFDSKDVFILDVGCEVFAWIGKDASAAEKAKALGFAQTYLKELGRPDWTPISRIFQGGENELFNSYLK